MSQRLESATVERKKRRRRTGKVERAGHLASWERSGVSGVEYARLHGLRASDLYRWRKLEGTGVEERAGRPDGGGSGSGFMTIDVDGRTLVGGVGGIRVVLRKGPLELEVSGAGTAGELVGLAGALKREVLDA